MKNCQIISSIDLNGYHLKIKNLIADTDNMMEPTFELLESMKSYCLWANPFVADEEIDDENIDVKDTNKKSN